MFVRAPNLRLPPAGYQDRCVSFERIIYRASGVRQRMTEREQALKNEIAELSIKLLEAKYRVEEALIQQEWKRKVRLLIKERRDKKVGKSETAKH